MQILPAKNQPRTHHPLAVNGTSLSSSPPSLLPTPNNARLHHTSARPADKTVTNGGLPPSRRSFEIGPSRSWGSLWRLGEGLGAVGKGLEKPDGKGPRMGAMPRIESEVGEPGTPKAGRQACRSNLTSPGLFISPGCGQIHDRTPVPQIHKGGPAPAARLAWSAAG